MKSISSQFKKSAEICGIEDLLKSKARVFVEKNKILGASLPKGVKVEKIEKENGVEFEIIVRKGLKIEDPLFFCFGVADKKATQMIDAKIVLEDKAEAVIFAHCAFPHAEAVEHKMKGEFVLGKEARLEYNEYHYHGEKSGAIVIPKIKVSVDENGFFGSNFVLASGTVGKTEIGLEVVLQKNAKAEIETKVLGKNAKDLVNIFDKVVMEGENSRSLIKMRAAAKNGGRVLMQGETYANAPGAYGHVDCQEIVVGEKSVAKAVPIVEVGNDQARITHEASVGKINQKELETLMTRGLNEDEATELIIGAMMR